MFGENALLLDIRSPSTSADAYGEPADDGVVVWQGRVPATLRREELQPNVQPVTSIGSAPGTRVQTIVQNDQLIVRTGTGIVATVFAGGRGTGYTVLVDDRRTSPSVQHRYTIRDVQLRAGATPGQSLRLGLQDGP